MSVLKKATVGLVVLIGVVNIGALVGHSIRKPIRHVESQITYPPVGDYTTYTVIVNPDGSYTIDYRSHDPRIVDTETYVDSSNGAFGIGGRSTTQITRSHIAGESGGVVEEGKNNARSEECIKAEGGGESNGALVGASVASGLAPLVTGIPYIGWLASGWVMMFGTDLGSSVGGEIASTLKGC